jgi:very-short-patch-repair endonuclease
MSKWRAREMRNDPTLAERRLWAILHSLRQQGYHFRRQVQIGPYYADIACHDARLIIEVDGATHSTDEEISYDQRRERYLRSRGFRTLRLWNSDIAANSSGVGEAILNALNGIEPLAPTPDPSPRGGGVPRNRKLRTGMAELAARVGEP